MRDKAYIKRIASYLLEVAKKEGKFSQIEEEMRLALGVLKNKRMERLLTHPGLSKKDKIPLLKEALRAYSLSKEVLSLIYLLIEDDALPLLKNILSEYRSLSYEAQGLKEVFLTTAIPLDDEMREKTKESFETITGSKVVLNVKVDPTIGGGMIAKIGDKLIDGSIRTMLSQIRDELMK